MAENKKNNVNISQLLSVGIAIVYVLLVFYVAYLLFSEGTSGNFSFFKGQVFERVVAIGVISSLTMTVALLALRDVKEVFTGLFYGGVTAIILSLVLSYFAIIDSDPTGTAIYLSAVFTFMLVLVGYNRNSTHQVSPPPNPPSIDTPTENQ